MDNNNFGDQIIKLSSKDMTSLKGGRVSDEQLAIYDDCMDTMEGAGATYGSSHRHCKRRAQSEA